MRKSEIKCLKYTTEDWIRVLHENILWAEAELEDLQGFDYENIGDKLGLSHALGVYKQQLKEIDPEHPYQLSWLLKCLAGENYKLKGEIRYIRNQINSILDKKKEEASKKRIHRY